MLAVAGSLCALPLRVFSQTLSGFYYRDYSKCLPDYLSTLANAAYEKRSRELSLLTDPSRIGKRQAWVRETFWQLVGGEPPRTPLNPRVTGEFNRPGYRLQKVVYQSRPGLFVTANLYIPDRSNPPYPGVLFQMGHYYTGKAYPTYQKCCQGLARLGYVVLAFDPMGQGERIAYPDESGTNTRLESIDAEHTVPGKQLLLLGDTASRHQVWDAIRSLDYLASLPFVDPKRLASAGQSGGGTLTMLLACADSRLAAAAVCSGNTENVATRDFNPPGSTDDAEQDLIGSGPLGFDRWDLLYPLAPKPLLVLVSAHDFFGTYSPGYLSNGREEYQRLAQCYELLGRPGQLAWRSTPLPHSLSYSLRLDIYNWFEKWLKNSEQPIREEPPLNPETERTLWVGPTGNVGRDFSSLRPFSLVKQQASSVSSPRQGEHWMQSLGIQFPARQLSLRKLERTPMGHAHVEAVEIQSTPEVWIPAWLFSPDEPRANPKTLLVFDDRGRNKHSGEDGVYNRLARQGWVVCAADVRGIGDMQPEVGRGNPRYTIQHDSEEDMAWASLILGHSLLAQRIEDILAVAQAIRNDAALGQRPLVIAARGALTVPALFAFAACRLIDSSYLAGGLVSYENLLNTENYEQPLANFAWDLYSVTDLPQLAAQSAPRPVHLAGVVDAANKSVELTLLRRIYSTPNVTFSEQAKWDEGAFQSC